jgi:hypothetical protein
VNLLSLSLRNPRRLILAWLHCMGASVRESRVSVAIYSLDVVGYPGLHQSGITSLCLVGCFSPGPRRNDLMIYWALGPFVRSFTPLVDPGVGRSGVRRLPGLSPSPSPGVGRSGVSYGARGRACLLSSSLCRVAQQSVRRRRRCPLVRPVSGAAK